MPYKSIDDLPSAVKDNLPKGAQEIYKDAYNASYNKHKDWDDAKRAQYAWGAVKKVYKKDEDGKWVKKEDLEAGEPKSDAERCIEHFFDGDKEKWDTLTDKEKKEYIKKLPKRGSKLAANITRTERERCLEHYNLTPEEWDELTEADKQEKVDGLPAWTEDDAKLSQHYFQISNQMWNRLKPEIQEVFVDEMRLEYYGTDAVVEGPDSDSRIDWLEQDVSNLYRTIWDNYEDLNDKFERINQRINDIIALIGGRTVQNQDLVLDGGELKLSDGEDSEGSVTYQLENLEWKKLEDQNVYKISGTLIAEGTWTGIDGHTVFYPREVIEASCAGIVGKAIKRGHGDSDDDVIGFVTAAAFKDDRAIFEGIIFDALTIEDIGSGDVTGTSMEALVKTKWDADQGYHIAQSMKLLKATVVKRPACKTCNDLSLAGSVALEDTNGDGDMSTQTDQSSDQTPVLDIVNLSDGCFYEKLEEELLKTDLGRDPVKEFMSIIRGIIRVSDKISRMRFDYPETKTDDDGFDSDSVMNMSDTTGKMFYTTDSGQQFVTSDSVSITVTDGWDDGTSTGTWIWPTTTDDTITWIPYVVPSDLQDGSGTSQDNDNDQNKSTKLDSDIGDKEMSTELENMKAELADVKTKLASFDAEKTDLETKLSDAEDKVTNLEGKVTALEADVATKDGEIAEKDGKLAALSKKLEDIEKAEVVALEAKIKEIQEDFDKEALLADVEDLGLQKKMLASYFETASKLKKTTKLGVDDTGDAQKKVEAILAEMGFSDVDAFIERK